MPQLDNKPDPFRRGQEQLSAEALNMIVRAVLRQLRGGGDNLVSYYNDRVVVSSKDSLPNSVHPGNFYAQFVVLEEFDDYLLCAPYFPPQHNGTWTPQTYDADLGQDSIVKVYVAKPYNLQRTPWDNRFIAAQVGVRPQETGNLLSSFTYVNIGERNTYLASLSAGQLPATLIPGGTLTEGTAYFYSIMAVTDDPPGLTVSEFSNQQEIIPLDSVSGTLLTWVDNFIVNEDPHFAVAFYVYRSIRSNGWTDPGSYVGQVVSTQFQFVDTGSPPIPGFTATASTIPGFSFFDGTVEYFYIVVPVLSGPGGTGPEIAPSNEVSVTPTSSDIVMISWTPYPGATGYNIYRTVTSGDYSGDDTPIGGTLLAFVLEGFGDFINDDGTIPLGLNYMTQWVGVNETQFITPGYFQGEVIVAIINVTGLQDPTGVDISWMDMNTAGRLWLAAQSFTVSLAPSSGPFLPADGVFSDVYNIFVDTHAGFELSGTASSPFAVGSVIISQSPADDGIPGYVAPFEQVFTGRKIFLNGTGLAVSPTYVPVVNTDLNNFSSQVLYLIGLTGDLSVVDSWINTPQVATSQGFNTYRYFTTDPVTGVITESGFGFGQASQFENLDIFGFCMHIRGDPFAIPDYTLCTGFIAGHALFTGVDGFGAKFINGLRLA